jgi:hypothetical protein
MSGWSYSGIKDFEQCARKYHEVKVLKKYKRQETAQTLYGTQLHKHAETFIEDGVPLPTAFAFLQPVMEAIERMPGTKLCEHAMGLLEDLTPCEFMDAACWTRGVADLIVIAPDGASARCFDYKTGNDRYPDTDQLLLMALMIFQHFPTVQRVSGGLLFVLKGTVFRHQVERHQAEKLWWRWRERVARLDAARAANRWPETRSGLCRKHCPVLDCPFNGA